MDLEVADCDEDGETVNVGLEALLEVDVLLFHEDAMPLDDPTPLLVPGRGGIVLEDAPAKGFN